MEEDVEQAATSRLCDKGPSRMAAGTGNRLTAGHLGIEQQDGDLLRKSLMYVLG